MSNYGERDTFDDLRTCFSTAEWNQLADGDRTRYRNIMKNHLYKLSVGLTSVPPDFMSTRDGGVAAGKAPLPKPRKEAVASGGEEEEEEWSLRLSDAHTETDGRTTAAPAQDDAEQDDISTGDHNIFCDLCKQFFLEECEIHGPPAFMAAAEGRMAVGEIHRANGNDTPTPRFEIGQSDACLRVFYCDAYEVRVGTEEVVESGYRRYNNYRGSIGAKEQASTRPGEEAKTRRLVYAGRKPHVCKQCDKAFSHSGDLNRHQLIHTGEKPFRCKECEKSFSRFDTLNTHQRIHTGERPFQCRQCDKAFSHLDSLKRHRRVHTGEKPFHCRHCDKRFSHLDTLKRHQRVHDGEKPFHCTQCEKSFSQVCNLKTHQRLHTGEKPYNCQRCDRSFNVFAHLKTHQRQHAVGGKPPCCTT